MVRNGSSLLWRYISLAVLAATIGLLQSTSTARADWYYNLVRITCVPDASFASVETFGLYNIDEPHGLEKQGIYHLADIKGQPIECALPHGKVSIEVVWYHEPQARGECGGVEDASLKVSLNGIEVAMVKSTHGGCGSWYQHEVQVSRYSVLHCALEFEHPPELIKSGDFMPLPTKCESLKIWP